MRGKAAITVLRSREDVERLWQSPEHRPGFVGRADVAVTFAEAPGDRGTEIHVALERRGGLARVLGPLRGSAPLAKVEDELRHFKQRVETGEIARSDGVPEGERAERKLKQRPAQPLTESELEKAGV